MRYLSVNRDTLANKSAYGISLDSFVPPSQIKQRFPNATAIGLNFYNESATDVDSYLQELCDTISFESFHLSCRQLTRLPTTLWSKRLIYFVLKIKEKNPVFIEPPVDFENHLKEIEIEQVFNIAPNLFDTPTLVKMRLLDIGFCTGFSGISGACHLETLMLYRCDNEFLDFKATRLTQLQRLEIHDCPNLQLLPPLGACTALGEIRLTRLNRLQTLANDWDAFQKLNHLHLDLTGNDKCNGLSFKSLYNLKKLSIHLLNDSKGNLLGAMPVLEELRLSSIQTPSWAADLFESPYLNSIQVHCCQVVPAFRAQLPPLLKRLEVTGCIGFAFPKGLLVDKVLDKFLYDFPFNAPHAIDKFSMRRETLTQLKKWDLSAQNCEILEQCWLHGLDKVTDWATFSEGFFQLLQLKPVLFKTVVHESLRFLCPNHQSALPYTTFTAKTVCFMGALVGTKNTYKQKLIEIGFVIHAKPKKDTDLLIIGDAVHDFPIDFWNHPHYFWSENELNDFIAVQNPGFLQQETAQMDHSIDNLRALLWSENVENELVALELMKTGGVPNEVLPDLVVLAKLYGSPNKGAVKKLIKPLLSATALKIVAHNSLMSINEFRIYQKLAPDFDVAQMIVCYYKKNNYSSALATYFRMVDDTPHPARPQMLKEAFEWILSQDYVRFQDWYFTASELTTLLNLVVEKNEITRLHIYNWLEMPLLSVFNLTQLRTLYMNFPLEAFPDIVVQLQQLEYLELYTSTLKTLPISLLNINTLKKLVIYNEEPIGLPSAFKILETRLELFDFKKGFYYQP